MSKKTNKRSFSKNNRMNKKTKKKQRKNVLVRRQQGVLKIIK